MADAPKGYGPPKAGNFRINAISPDLARADLPKWTAIYQDLFR